MHVYIYSKYIMMESFSAIACVSIPYIPNVCMPCTPTSRHVVTRRIVSNGLDLVHILFQFLQFQTIAIIS